MVTIITIISIISVIITVIITISSIIAATKDTIIPIQLSGVACVSPAAWRVSWHQPNSLIRHHGSLRPRSYVQSSGHSNYFGKEVSFSFKFHCLLRSRVLPLSKNRSSELIFLP